MKYATGRDGKREGALSHMAAASKADHSSLNCFKWCSCGGAVLQGGQQELYIIFIIILYHMFLQACHVDN